MSSKGKFKEDLVGKVFGMVTVLRHYSGVWKGIPNRVVCDCKCECGNEFTILSYRLTLYGQKSCGCYKDEWNRKDLSGMTFGKWTVLERGPNIIKGDKKPRSYTTWICQCSCEKKTIKQVQSRHLLNGKSTSCGCHGRAMLDKYRMNGSDEQHPGWKGGVSYYKNRIALYDTYSPQLEPIEGTRRNADNPEMLEVQCYHCKTWMIPTLVNTMNRAKSIDGKATGENHFYCSDLCRANCDIFGSITTPKSKRNKRGQDRSSQVQSELKDIVISRDGAECIRCGSTEDLICHHIEGIRYNPLESADADLSVIFCKKCHVEIHQEPGCKNHELWCRQ